MREGALMIQVFNTLSRQKEPIRSQRDGVLTVYVCGVTPYDEAHIGHARPAVVWDAIKRHLQRRGYVVWHVQNFTDIDDKIVERAGALGISVDELAERHMARYAGYMQRLRIDPPHAYPRVTDNMAQIIDYIADLIAKGYGYESAGDVYFHVARAHSYGKLSGRTTDREMAVSRLQARAQKDHASDFALWKASRPGEPFWESPWGRGRPGWHIECSALADDVLGEQIDLHGGGIDLVFPHHENEIAQTEAHLGRPVTTMFVHNGLVTLGDVKMSKSLGNGVGLGELFERWDPLVIRTYLLSAHYRSPLAFEEQRLAEWKTALDRIHALYQDVKDFGPPSVLPPEPAIRDLMNFETEFLSLLDDDFNTAKALAKVFEMVRKVRPLIDAGGALGQAVGFLTQKNLTQANDIFQFLPVDTMSAAPSPASDDMLQDLLAVRQRARAKHAFEWADAIRDVLVAHGWKIEDTPAGPRLTPSEASDATV